MGRIKALRGLFAHPEGESSVAQGFLEEMRKEGSARTQFLITAFGAMDAVVKWVAGALAVFVAILLLKAGHLVFVATVAAAVLTLFKQYRVAGILLIVIGTAGTIGYLSELGTIGTDLDTDAYRGDATEASPTVGGLLWVVLLTGGAFLVKNGRYAVSELALVFLIVFFEWLVFDFKALEDLGKILLVLFYLALLMLAFVILFFLLGKRKNVIVGTVMVAAMNAGWLLLPHGGGPDAEAGSNFDTWGGGFVEQALYGGLLVGLGAFFLVWLPRLLASEPEETDSGQEPETEEQPVDAENEAFVADQPDEVKAAWAKMPLEQRRLIPELLQVHLYVAPVVDVNDRFRESTLEEWRLKEHVDRSGLEVQHYLYFGSRKALTIVAGQADRHGTLQWTKRSREKGFRAGLRRKALAVLSGYAERQGMVLSDAVQKPVRPGVLEEMHITPEEIREEQARLAIHG